MRISDVEDDGGIGLVFILSGFSTAPAGVKYFRLTKQVLCLTCIRTRCEHIQFMRRVLVENETWKTADFIYDCCEVRMSFSEHQDMKTAFRDALIGLDIDEENKEPPPPKPNPSPFSLIDLD